ncbi:HNH endonuclease [Paenibacillus sp. FA6]|uniref:HNH endonuclease n=1 Tax=Paenibacillus sp. FA6 TaxID=3413029 RepID=UPI003F658502
MRSLIKGSKPAILVEKEDEWTNELMAFVLNDDKIPKTVNGRYGHPEIKAALLLETSNKCVYCESKITHIDHGDIEHIEPKSEVRNKTFLWDNLTIGCSKCNQNKKIYYDPLLPLLNPYIDIPEEKIIFCGPLPFPAKGNRNAEMTIRLLKLDRPELIERRTECIKSIDPLIIAYEQTDNHTLKGLIWDDIHDRTLPDKEFSLMIEQMIKVRLPVTA